MGTIGVRRDSKRMPAKEKAFHLVFAIGARPCRLSHPNCFYNFADFTVVPCPSAASSTEPKYPA